MHDKDHPPKILLEALLFSSSAPLSLRKIREILPFLSSQEIRDLASTLQKEYNEMGRAFQLEETPQGFLLRVRPVFHDILDLLHGKKAKRLSQAAHEVLAIVAYQQPITRAEIDGIRGVDSAGPLAQLIDKEFIASAGKLDAPGRPTLYQTTVQFMLQFGLKSLRDLPPLFESNHNQ